MISAWYAGFCGLFSNEFSRGKREGTKIPGTKWQQTRGRPYRVGCLVTKITQGVWVVL